MQGKVIKNIVKIIATAMLVCVMFACLTGCLYDDPAWYSTEKHIKRISTVVQMHYMNDGDYTSFTVQPLYAADGETVVMYLVEFKPHGFYFVTYEYSPKFTLFLRMYRKDSPNAPGSNGRQWSGYRFSGERWCSDLYERQVIGYDDTKVNIFYDDCNPFGVVAGDFGEAENIPKHTDSAASDDIITGFNNLGESYAAFIGNFPNPTGNISISENESGYKAYSDFYKKMATLYNDSLVSFAKNHNGILANGAFVGINNDYQITFGSDKSDVDLRELTAKLFGFDKEEFIEYGKDLANQCLLNEDTQNNALENGCFHTENGYFIFPIVIRNKYSDSVLTYVIVDEEGNSSVWIRDINTALKALNFENRYRTDTMNNKLYCKNLLYVTELYEQPENYGDSVWIQGQGYGYWNMSEYMATWYESDGENAIKYVDSPYTVAGVSTKEKRYLLRLKDGNGEKTDNYIPAIKVGEEYLNLMSMRTFKYDENLIDDENEHFDMSFISCSAFNL